MTIQRWARRAVSKPQDMLTVDMGSVSLEGEHFSRVRLRDFLSGLARKVEKRDADRRDC